MEPITYTWECPQCQRRVPTRLVSCLCGFDRSLAGLGPLAIGRASARSRAHRTLAAAVVAAGAVLVAGVAWWWSSMQREGTAPSSSTELPPAYAPLPAAVSPDEPTSAGSIEPLPGIEDAGIEPGRRVSSGDGAIEPVSPEGEPATVEARSSTAVEGPTDPSPEPTERRPTSMETAWLKATGLLEPRLEAIADETESLEFRYRRYVETCFDPASRPPNPPPGHGGWLEALKTTTDKGSREYCETWWKSLMSRAGELKAELDESEEVARTRGVLPGHWRRLVTAQGLDDLRDF